MNCNCEKETCPVCDLLHESINEILEAKYSQDVVEIVKEIIDRALILGERRAIIDDIHEKMAYLEDIGDGMDCDCE